MLRRKLNLALYLLTSITHPFQTTFIQYNKILFFLHKNTYQKTLLFKAPLNIAPSDQPQY